MTERKLTVEEIEAIKHGVETHILPIRYAADALNLCHTALANAAEVEVLWKALDKVGVSEWGICQLCAADLPNNEGEHHDPCPLSLPLGQAGAEIVEKARSADRMRGAIQLFQRRAASKHPYKHSINCDLCFWLDDLKAALRGEEQKDDEKS